MKKHCTLILAALLVMSMMFTACEGSEFVCTTSDDKNAVIEAKNAGTDSQLLSGTLEIAEGDTITVDCTALESGSMVIDSITAYGAGGDTDYGLSMEDLETVFKDLQ